MGELVINYHDFKNAKKEIKKFSEQPITDLDLKRVDDSKGIGEFWGDLLLGRGIGLNHNVNGEELNQLTTQIQTHLCSINNTQIKLIKEFGQVYSALEALDNDYIRAILVSIKATEKTSQSIQEAQVQIKKIVENQRKTLEELKKFKQKLDSYAHLGDIDRIWSNCQKWHQEMYALSQSIDCAAESSTESAKKVNAIKIALATAEKKINDLSKESSLLTQRLESIAAFVSAVEKITHLHDVDEMWNSLSLVKVEVSRYQEDIKNFLAFREKLFDIKHLFEVDAIWSREEDNHLRLLELGNTSKEHTAKLNELEQKDDSLLENINETKGNIKQLDEYKEKLSKLSHLQDVDGIWDDVEKQSAQLNTLENQIQSNKENTDITLANAIQQSNDAIEIMAKKVKYAYLIAGGSAGLVIIELIVLLMKVI